MKRQIDEISKRMFFKKLLSFSVASSAFGLIGKAIAATKISKQSVAYQDTPKDTRICKDCNLFLAPDACKNVDGAISEQGWCRLWSKKA
jgi:hypothetical protein